MHKKTEISRGSKLVRNSRDKGEARSFISMAVLWENAGSEACSINLFERFTNQHALKIFFDLLHTLEIEASTLFRNFIRKLTCC